MPPSTLTTADHIELLGAEAARLASSLTGADLEATVVTCPDWTVRDLVSHVGGLHRWSGSWWRTASWPRRGGRRCRSTTPTAPRPRSLARMADDRGRRGMPDVRRRRTGGPVWAWGADQHARFWRDACCSRPPSTGSTSTSPWGGRRTCRCTWRSRASTSNWRTCPSWRGGTARWAGCGGGPDARFAATDADGSWRVRLEADGWWWDRGSDGGDVVAEAGAVDLLLFLVGRPAADVAVRGDRALLDRWLAATAF